MKDTPTIRDTATEVVSALQKAGYTAYLAGGCVRDELMGSEPVDYDIATDAKPKIVKKLFRNTRAVGEHFGVILVYINGNSIEVATFRIDAGYSDRRHPDTVQFSDAKHDAMRRDFTINGIFMDPITGQIIDYVNGQDDLENRIIRAIGNPEDRLSEDHLRALRAVRFAARFDFKIEVCTQDAIRKHASKLKGISRERIGMETRMMMQHGSRTCAIDLLQVLQLDAPVLNGEHQNHELKRLNAISKNNTAITNGTKKLRYATTLAAWALDRNENTQSVVTRWRKALVLTNKETTAFKTLLSIRGNLIDNWVANFSVAQKKRLSSNTLFPDSLAILHAENPDLSDDISQEVETLKRTPAGLNPTPYMRGSDLIAIGFEPGPSFKHAIDSLYDAQLEDRVSSPDEAHKMALDLLSQKRKADSPDSPDSPE